MIQRGLRALAGSAALLVACQSAPALLNSGAVRLDKIGGFDHGPATAAEIVAYDPASQRLFVVNGNIGTIDVLSIANVSAPTLVNTINITAFGTGVNSVAIKNGVIAAAVENKDAATGAQGTGRVVFFNANGDVLSHVAVGALPDMLTFTPDGKRVVVANEGEANSYGQATSVNPEGSVSIVDLSAGVNAPTVVTAGFTAFNGQEAALNAAGIRIYGPGATAAQDLEPEYIAIAPDGKSAYVSVQEANAMATVDIDPASANYGKVVALKSWGLKDHNLPGAGFDGSDRDGPGTGSASQGLINIQNWPVKGMYMPDSIATFQVAGQTYIITANEGDARDFLGFNEETSVGNAGYLLDPGVFTAAQIAQLKSEDGIGRLTVTRASGNTDGDAEFEEIHAFGGRSFSIFKPDGTLVFDSGDAFEQLLKNDLKGFFNASHDNQNFDNRSDNKGPEPEAIAVAEFNNRLLAFIGLERVGGIVVYDITDPFNPFFVNYANSREFFLPFNAQNHGDLGPEGLIFISAADSPNGKALLVSANEVSGTTAIFQVNAVPEPATGMLAQCGLAALALRRRRA